MCLPGYGVLPVLLEIVGIISMHDYHLSSSLFWCLVVLLKQQIPTTIDDCAHTVSTNVLSVNYTDEQGQVSADFFSWTW